MRTLNQRKHFIMMKLQCKLRGLTTIRRGKARLALYLLVAVVATGILALGSPQPSMATAHARPASTPTPNPPIVINFSIISAARGAAILRSIYPDARITVDSHANAVIVVASGYDEEGMRTIARHRREESHRYGRSTRTDSKSSPRRRSNRGWAGSSRQLALSRHRTETS